MESDTGSVASLLRLKAEKLLKSIPQTKGTSTKEGEILKLLNELEVYSVQLELQNEVLKKSSDFVSYEANEIRSSEAVKYRIIHEFEVKQLELEMQNEELQLTRSVSQEIAERYSDLFNFSPSGYLILSNEGEIIELNRSGAKLLGKDRLQLKNSMFGFFIQDTDKLVFSDFLKDVFKNKSRTTCEVSLISTDLLPLYVQLTGILTQSEEQCLMTMVDITELRQANEFRALSREILQILNEPGSINDSIHRTLALLKKRTGTDAVGIRLQKGEDYPYFDQIGFPGDFMHLENTLLEQDKKRKMCRDGQGVIYRTCACGMVLQGKNETQNRYMSPGGSWWTNESYQLSEVSIQNESGYLPQNECLLEGYRSIAIVPIRSDHRILGLIHISDVRKGVFNRTKIESLEGIASHIGSALIRKQAEETLRENEEFLRTITANAPDIILELDHQGTILYMNKPYEGTILENCVGKNVLDWVYPEYSKILKDSLETVFNGHATDSFQYKVKNAHREGRWHRSRISPVKEGGMVKNAIMNTQDVTDELLNEAMLKESEEKRKALTVTSVDGFYITDTQGRLLEVNDAYCRISGYNQEELLTMRIQDLEYNETNEETARHIQAVIQKGEERFETRHRCKNGTLISLEANVQYRPIDGGQLIVFVHDITKQREAEMSLQQSDDRYKSLFQLNYSAILLYDPDTGDIIDANPAACQYYGWSFSELCTKTIYDLDPAPREETFVKLQSSKKRENNHLFVQHRLANGDLRDVEVFSGPIRFNESIMLYAIIHDVTGIKQAQEAARVIEQKYSFIYNSSLDGVFSLDMEGRFTNVNKSFCKEMQLELPQIIGHTYLELGLPEYLTAELANLQSQVLETNSSTHIEIKLPKPDGSVRYFELILNPLFDEGGNVVGIGGSGRNINRRKEAENALRQLNEDLEARVLERNAEILKSNEALKTAEEKYRTVSDFAFNWEYWVDQNDRMIYCSPACERVTGFKPTEFEQNPELIYAMSYPEDSLILRDHKMKELQGSVCDHEVQYRIIRKDGIIRWIGHFCRPVFDDSGIFKGTRGSNKDITARKKMEELLTTSNNKYRLLSENITDGIFICRNGMFEYANKAIYDIFGYQGRELEKIKLTQLVMTDYHEDLETFLYAMGPVDQSRSFEVECLRKDLSQVFVEIILRYVAKDSMIYGVAHDITEKKMLQKNTMKTIIQTEEKERSRFSKELHDGLGPLLSTIKLYLKWSERHSRNKAHKEIIEKAGEIVEEALVTVKEISNKLNPMILTNFGLEEAVSSFVQKLKETSRLNIFFDSNMKKRMDIETEATLYRVIIECINNTLKYARAKNIGITIKEDESQINVRYRDDGIGFNINEMLLNHQGLGLNNIMNRLQNIGGKAELKSEAGKGVDYLFVVKMGG